MAETISIEQYKKSVKGTASVRKKKNAHPEDKLQMDIIKFLQYTYPGIIPIHVPNGGKRSRAEAGIFKAMGVLPGVADIMIFQKTSALYPVIFLEVKAGTKQSPKQLEFENKIRKLGYCYFIVHSIDEVINCIQHLII